jgi:hypothetical protein
MEPIITLISFGNHNFSCYVVIIHVNACFIYHIDSTFASCHFKQCYCCITCRRCLCDNINHSFAIIMKGMLDFISLVSHGLGKIINGHMMIYCKN